MRLRLAAVPGVVLVAVAAAMWGTDPIIRKTMSFTTSATTIVFGEHVILVLCTLPFLFPALRAVFRAGPRYDPLHRRADRPLRLHHAGRHPEDPAVRRHRGRGARTRRAAAPGLLVV